MKSDLKILNCRCNPPGSTRYKCPGSDHCHHHCARMLTLLWGDADVEEVAARSIELGIPEYRGIYALAPRYSAQAAAMDELVRESERLGLYDLPPRDRVTER